MSARFAKEVTISAGVDFIVNGSSISGYTPAQTDKIIVTPIGPDSADANTGSDVTDGNIKAWVYWSNPNWKIKVSDSLFNGKIMIAIKK